MKDVNQLTHSLILFRCKLDNAAPYNRWSLKVTSFVFSHTIFFKYLMFAACATQWILNEELSVKT